ncbi:MAG: MMPL family transporter [Verrucomicrobia bacterium]|nr:MMPL family transporter [Verrucomicrobiota bacterium]
MKRSHWFYRVARFSVDRPWLVFTIACLLAILSFSATAVHLRLKTSNLDLVDPDLPAIKRFLDFANEFGTPNVLVVVLEGEDTAAMKRAVDELGPALRLVPGVRAVTDKIPLPSERLDRAGVNPYFTSRDLGMFMLFIQPEDARSQAETISPLLDQVRLVLAEKLQDAPNLRAGLTGIPQYAIDDRDVIQQDISTLSLFSFLLIGVIFVTAFAAMRRPLMAMVTLGFSVILLLGVITLYPGHLTLLSAFFASILFGLGIDYGIHIINRTEEFMNEGMTEQDALPLSISKLAPELTTGGITTSVIFFSMLACGFRGFAELGLIAGIGMILCLFLMISLFPALLTLIPHRQNRTISTRESRVGRLLMALQYPGITAALAIAAVALSLLGSPGFDGNYTDLQPKDSEAVRLEREMVTRSDLSPQFAVFTTDTKAAAIDLADQLLDEDTVGEVRSIADLEMLAPVDGPDAAWPDEFLQRFVSPSGRYAVYAYPSGDVWNPIEQEAFVTSMQAIDPAVTGMPVLGRFMTDLSNRALIITGVVGGILMFLCVWANYRRLLPSLLAILPTLFTVAGMHGVMKLLHIPFNPINIMALPVILGIAVDDGVHMVHRFIQEKGDLQRTLSGSGRSVVLTSLTTIAAFGSLIFTRHQGLASFALLLVIGVAMALMLSVLLLPRLLILARKHLVR